MKDSARVSIVQLLSKGPDGQDVIHLPVLKEVIGERMGKAYHTKNKSFAFITFNKYQE
jgi:hypothetical protein